ncbi:hypothetical protein SARC_01689 [Sphaeroforma arctica JP610]|uniref:Mitochondrial-processing peptidase subunit beta n=1 Tax=Sphaeroforma arctica JP610 TaxID=667725 RepID=A0A0L0GD51_9EUKA|nr:hypothetical protein SARC_01689 [Sphaeroforma arctica JP610]KNC86163.1 hypothetical protein SARC_01689 [Sphaeroforma arctica JP610]|eukprot:XP_014160065.1 hypothetical protein SARC_01689 [Sphaeroforma arctica JP610]
MWCKGLPMAASTAPYSPFTTTLSNGLRVATQKTTNSAATVGLYVDAGSRFETPDNHGIANFVEHLMYKGKAAGAMAKVGGELGAWTGREITSYYARTSAAKAADAVGVLGGCLTNPTFSDVDMAAAQREVLMQMSAQDQDKEAVAMDYLHSTAYQGTALASPVLGPTSNVQQFTQADVSTYLKNNFTGPRIVLAASGNVDHDALVKAAEKALGSLSSEEGAHLVDPPRFTGSMVNFRDDEMPYCYAALGLQAVGASHPDYFALSVAAEMIGQWDHSFSFADNRGSKLTSELITVRVVLEFQLFQTITYTPSITGWLRIMCTACPEVYTERAKNTLKNNMLLSLESSTAAADDIGRQMLAYGRVMPQNEIVSRIDAVTTAEVQSVLVKYIYDQCPAVAVVGQTEAVPDYNRIRSGQFWLRV